MNTDLNEENITIDYENALMLWWIGQNHVSDDASDLV